MTRRTLGAALLVGLALAALVGGWFITGWRSVGAEAEALRAAPRAEAERRAAALAVELASRVEEIRAAESQRPYYEYQNLYHDPRGASQGMSVAPSPLARGPEDPLVAVHFQMTPGGDLSVPTVNEEVPELSDPARAPADRVVLAALREVAPELRPEAVAVAPDPSRPPQPQAAPVKRARRRKPPPQPQQQVAMQQAPPQQEVQAVDSSSYAQNQMANNVYLDVQQQQAPRKKPAATPTPTPTPSTKAQERVVEIRIGSFGWRTVNLDGRPHLVAVRAVGTPDGTLTQGFALSPDALASWLAERQGDLPARLASGFSDDDTAAAAVPLAGATWNVQVDPAPAAAAADARAHDLRSGFLLQFLPAAALALLCGALVVLLVARADRLARQRSGFAAAAAHELRTPLAGLALYGDMLADGLGDPGKRADYARRISDEAARLGRVVGNVLGFTQLERRALAVSPRAADAVRLARDAADRMRAALEHAGVVLVADLPDAAPARFDEDAAHRILQNLLDNAEKYTRGAADRTVSLAVRSEGGRVLVDVADRGPGVAPTLARRLFRPFVRSEGEGAPAGLGLGLALARAQARAMGGDLTQRPRDGGGAVFTLDLPAG